MASLLATVAEDNRQRVTGDNKFYKKPLYYFELEIPSLQTEGSGTRLAFPLVLNPENITITEPFTVAATPTQGGGIFIEENGIIQRTLRIQGHTGFRPRNYHGAQIYDYSKLLAPEKRSFSRDIVHLVYAALSGQRHFQFLQDAVFRTYADLKKDPATAKDTHLYFHNPKDDEHWLVVPQNFTLNRDKSDRVLYHYAIDLLIVGVTTDSKPDFSESKSLIDEIKDTARSIQNGIELVSGGLKDLTNMVGEIKGFIKNIDTIISSATGIIDSAADFLAGTTDLIKAPIHVVENAGLSLASSLSNLETQASLLGTTVTHFPDSVRQSLRNIEDGFNAIGAHPEAFSTKLNSNASALAALSELSTSVSSEALTAAEDAGGPRSFEAVKNLGTAPLPGDKSRAATESGIGRKVPKFTGVQERIIEQGDTLTNLAARYLGDARLWRHIAILNDLRPPYIGTHGAPNTLKLGDKIIIPTFTKAQTDRPLLATLGAKLTEPFEDQVLGTDLLLTEDPETRLFDLVVNANGGATDIKTTHGINNLSQAIRTRLSIEQGTDPLFKNIGVKRIIGFGLTVLDQDFVPFRVTEAITADPRIATVRNVAISNIIDPSPKPPVNADTVELEVDVEVRGFVQPLRFETSV